MNRVLLSLVLLASLATPAAAQDDCVSLVVSLPVEQADSIQVQAIADRVERQLETLGLMCPPGTDVVMIVGPSSPIGTEPLYRPQWLYSDTSVIRTAVYLSLHYLKRDPQRPQFDVFVLIHGVSNFPGRGLMTYGPFRLGWAYDHTSTAEVATAIVDSVLRFVRR